MKFMIASDLHGSRYYAEKVSERFVSEKADRLILLGDIYNHGPRNPLPREYDPMGVADILNPLACVLTVVKGNCDSDVDKMISDFEFVSEAVLIADGKQVFLQHGDRYSIDQLPKNCGDAFIYGHYHTGFIKRKGNVLVGNCGSVSLPKDGTPNSYMILENGELILKDIGGEELEREKI